LQSDLFSDALQELEQMFQKNNLSECIIKINGQDWKQLELITSKSGTFKWA
jgi:hypothetical protein